MNTFLVGGAVRDLLLMLSPKDRDYVVTDTTDHELISLGFVKVGQSFPVYLHPDTKDEYTLTSSLTENLHSRDLTINAIAMDVNGLLIDPFHGLRDLELKTLRHVARENFVIDPIRTLRTARFLATLPGFKVAPETESMLRELSTKPFMKEVLPERVLNEVNRTLKTRNPSSFFSALRDWNLLEVFFPELMLNDEQWSQLMKVLDSSCVLTEVTAIRYAALVHALNEHEVRALGKRLLVPNDWAEAAQVIVRYMATFPKGVEPDPTAVIDLFYDLDLFRKPYLMDILLMLLKAMDKNSLVGAKLNSCFETVKAITIKDIDPTVHGKDIGEAMRKIRLKVSGTFWTGYCKR